MKKQKAKSTSYKILVFGDIHQNAVLNGLSLNGMNCELLTSHEKDQAISIVNQDNPQIILVDIDRAEPGSLEFVSQLCEDFSNLMSIGLTKTNPLITVVKAVKLGIHEIINTKDEPTKLQQVLSRLTKQWHENGKGEELYKKQKQKYDFNTIIGQSPKMQHIYEIISKIVRQKWVTVLIRGETGTGKELIARTIHYNSFEQYQPFIEISCTALPENLLESELFGYEKGAFTDAKSQKKGLFELAQNGTLFLDEIGELSLTVQAKLLKVLEEKNIRRLGGIKDLQINARLISATNRDLKATMRENLFRNDLYYRLNVVSIQLPPLRERGEDVILLCRHFLNHYLKEYKSPLQKFSPEAEDLLRSYHWPGNVRELKHTIERLVLLNEGREVSKATLADIIDTETPLITKQKEPATNLPIHTLEEGMSLDEAEKIFVLNVLNKMNWNKRKTCQTLKIARTSLDRKIRKYGLTPNNHK